MVIKIRFMVFVTGACLLLSSCTNPGVVSSSGEKTDRLAGKWLGSGVDSKGNEFTFVAEATSLGDDKYRMVTFDEPDTEGEPIHIVDGVMNGNKFVYTADEKVYTGECLFDGEVLTGYYKGKPGSGTFEMRRVK